MRCTVLIHMSGLPDMRVKQIQGKGMGRGSMSGRDPSGLVFYQGCSVCRERAPSSVTLALASELGRVETDALYVEPVAQSLLGAQTRDACALCRAAHLVEGDWLKE